MSAVFGRPLGRCTGVLCALLGSWASAAEPAVGWGGDYVTANRAFNRSNVGANLDYQADGVQDRRQSYAFSATMPMNPSSNYTVTPTNSGRFYGGVDYWRLVSTSSFSASSGHGVLNATASTGGDTLGIHQTNQTNRRQFAVFLWDKADFLTASLAQAESVGFDETCSLSLTVRLNQSNHHTYRFLVLNGSQFYVSSFSSAATGTLGGSDLMNATWAAYNPGADLRPVPGSDVGASSLSYTTPTSSFDDIRGIGVYIESVTAASSGDRSFRFEQFTASAVELNTALPLGPNNLSVASPLGGSGTADRVVGSVVQPDGTIVLAALISDAAPGGLTPILLNGATETTSGALVRLSANGQQVLSVTRIAADLWDLDRDGFGRLYVACGAGGLLVLDSQATAVLWSATGSAQRVAAGSDGTSAVLGGAYGSWGGAPNARGTITVRSAEGVQLGSFTGHGGSSHRTYDIAMDSGTQRVFACGFQQSSGTPSYGGSNVPVQVAYVKATNYSGTQLWRAYDWAGSQVDYPQSTEDPALHLSSMADTRGCRLCVGPDGAVYVAFMAAGGDHIIRYHPQVFKQWVVKQNTIDKYHYFANSRSEHKLIVGVYHQDDGNVLRWQEYCARLNPELALGQTNTFRVDRGNIAVDLQGRIYLAGWSASGGPDGVNEKLGLPYTFNPIPVQVGVYGGGPTLMVMSNNMNQRLYVGRHGTGAATTGERGETYALAVGLAPGAIDPTVVWGGQLAAGTTGIFSAWNPLQTGNAARDGFVIVHAGITFP